MASLLRSQRTREDSPGSVGSRSDSHYYWYSRCPSIGTVVVHHSRDFRRRRGRRKKLVEIEQPLRSIPVYEWERKDYPEAWYRYFRHELVLRWNRHWEPVGFSC